MSLNEVLKNSGDIEAAYGILQKQGRAVIPDPGKSWDLLKAFEFVVAHGKTESRVLDMGTFGCRLLELLVSRGFRRMFGCDMAPVEWRRLVSQHMASGRISDLLTGFLGWGPIRLSRQDLQKTNFPDGYFDFVVSLSVIEHGVDIRAYFRESARLLVSGGYLVTSCDYWPQKVDTTGMSLFNAPWVILSQNEIEEMLRVSCEYGFQLVEPIDYTCVAPAVDSNGKQYTFLFFVMQKI